MQIFRFVPRKPCLATDLHRLWKIIQLIGVACTALWRCVTQVTSRTGLHMASACRKFQKRPSALEACIFCPGAVCKKSKRRQTSAREHFGRVLSCLSCRACHSSLPGWPGLSHAGVPQPGDLVLSGHFPYAGASGLSPVSPSVTT